MLYDQGVESSLTGEFYQGYDGGRGSSYNKNSHGNCTYNGTTIVYNGGMTVGGNYSGGNTHLVSTNKVDITDYDYLVMESGGILINKSGLYANDYIGIASTNNDAAYTKQNNYKQGVENSISNLHRTVCDIRDYSGEYYIKFGITRSTDYGIPSYSAWSYIYRIYLWKDTFDTDYTPPIYLPLSSL